MGKPSAPGCNCDLQHSPQPLRINPEQKLKGSDTDCRRLLILLALRRMQGAGEARRALSAMRCSFRVQARGANARCILCKPEQGAVAIELANCPSDGCAPRQATLGKPSKQCLVCSYVLRLRPAVLPLLVVADAD